DQHGLGALGGEVLGDGLADAGAGTGDDGDAVLKLFHGRLSNAVSRRCRSSRSGTRAKSSWSSRPWSRSAAATSIQNDSGLPQGPCGRFRCILTGCGKTEQGSRSDSDPFTWGFGYVHGQNEFFRSLKPAVSWHSGFREGAHARRKTT